MAVDPALRGTEPLSLAEGEAGKRLDRLHLGLT